MMKTEQGVSVLSALKRHLTDENRAEDVWVMETASLEPEYAFRFTKPWFIVFADARVVEYDTEEEACKAQREWRKLIGLNAATGDAPLTTKKPLYGKERWRA